MTDFNWTAERDDQLRAMRADGLPFSQCAAKIGCRRNSAIGRAHRLGIVGAPRPKAEGGRLRKARPVSVSKSKRAEAEVKQAIERGYRIVPIPRRLPPEPPRRPGKWCTIFEVTGCRYIFGDPRAADHSYCNAPRVEGVSYCPEHAAICFGRQA